MVLSTYIYHKNQPNVGKYTIHGSYGVDETSPFYWLMMSNKSMPFLHFKLPTSPATWCRIIQGLGKVDHVMRHLQQNTCRMPVFGCCLWEMSGQYANPMEPMGMMFILSIPKTNSKSNWKWCLGERFAFWVSAYFQVQTVTFREGGCFFLNPVTMYTLED